MFALPMMCIITCAMWDLPEQYFPHTLPTSQIDGMSDVVHFVTLMDKIMDRIHKYSLSNTLLLNTSTEVIV